MNILKKVSLTMALALGLATTMASSAQDSPLTVTTVAQIEQVVTDASGQRSTRLVEAARVVPGQEVVYTITVANRGKQPAQDVAVNNPIPAELAYVADSAGSIGSVIEFSADGGKSYGAASDLRLKEAGGLERPARADEYTHVRFTLKHAIAPGQVAVARYRAVVR